MVRLTPSSQEQVTYNRGHMTNISVNQVNIPDLNIDFVRSLPRVNLSQRTELPEEKGLYFVCVEYPEFQVLYIGQTFNFKQRLYNHSKQDEFAIVHMTQTVWIHYKTLEWSREDIVLFEELLIKKLSPVFNIVGIKSSGDVATPELSETQKHCAIRNLSKPLLAHSSEELIMVLGELGVPVIGKQKSRKWMIGTIKKILLTKQVSYSDSQFLEADISFTDSSNDKSVKAEFVIGHNTDDLVNSIPENYISLINQINDKNPSSYSHITIREMRKIAMHLKICRYGTMTKDELAANISTVMRLIS